jgi:hypothetical protein
VGFNWARQWQLRAWKGFSDKAWIVGSVEAPQTTFSARGAADNFVLGQAGGSLLNATANYSTDIYPDAVMKLVFEPGYGHFELKALGRAFRDRIFDVADTMGGTHNHVTYGGGVGAAIVLPVNVPEDGGKTRDVFDFGVSGLWGIGIGRYGSGSLPDATVRPNGAISPIRGAQALLTLEAHPSRRLDVYVYGGAEYDARNASIIGAAGEGYGSNLFNVSGCGTEANPTNDYTPAAGTCNADTRALYQGNAGFWYKFYQGPYGAFQWGMQYSYTTRAIWSGAASYQPTAIDQMGFLSFRYVIP